MKWIRLLLIIPAVLVLLLAYSIKNRPPGPLTDADIHIVEAWIPPSSLEYTADYLVKNAIDSVYIVGVGSKPLAKKSTDLKILNYPIDLISNGYVFLRPKELTKSGDSIHMDVEGSHASNIGSFVLIFANDTLFDQRIINGRDTISISCSNKLESLTVYFANDAYCTKNEDRNLRIHSVECDRGEIQLEKRLGGIYILPDKLGMTEAKKAQLYLEELNCSKVSFNLIERESDKNNKTLQAALLFKDWLAKRALSGNKLKVNIFTSENHSRRTYINYKNALKAYAEVGMITPEESVSNCNSSTVDHRLFNWLDETASSVYSSIYWLFR